MQKFELAHEPTEGPVYGASGRSRLVTLMGAFLITEKL